MIESKTRKAAFLREAVRTVGLVCGSLSQSDLRTWLSRRNLRNAADVITVRAVRGRRAALRSVRRDAEGYGAAFPVQTGS